MRTDVWFCIPTVLRSSILERTLLSFAKHCTPSLKEFHAIVHVDKAPPNPDCTIADVECVAQQHFGSVDVLVAQSNHGYAGSAKKLLQAFADAPRSVRYAFWLEDDWEVRRAFSIDEMLQLFTSATDREVPLLQVRLARGASMNNSVICTSPGLYAVELCDLLNRKLNPELSFESQVKSLCDETYGTRKCALTYLPKHRDTVVDIGRKWRKTRSIFKPNELGHKKRTFVRWVDKHNNLLES